MKSRKQKEEEIGYLKSELAEAENLIVVEYKGLNVEQDTVLRNKVRETRSKYRVVKNRLASIAAAGTPAEKLSSSFHGPVALAYNSKDPVSLAKVLSEYARENPLFVFRAGMVEGRVVEVSRLTEIAEIPPYEELLGKLMYVINAPAQRIAVGTGAVVRNLAVALGQAVEQEKFGSEP